MKPLLAQREKRILMVVIPLQVCPYHLPECTGATPAHGTKHADRVVTVAPVVHCLCRCCQDEGAHVQEQPREDRLAQSMKG